MRQIGPEELARHTDISDCWIAVEGRVYDVTDFLARHPGGIDVLARWAGQDATAAFLGQHPPGVIASLGTSALVGHLAGWKESSPAAPKANIPPLESLLSLEDFEPVAEAVMGPAAWVYYCSGAEDECTLRANREAFGRWWFRPRVLVDVSRVDASTTILGCPSAFPVFLSASALSVLAHPDAEVALALATRKAGVPQMVPTLSARPPEEICRARGPEQTQFFQLYVNRDHGVTRDLVRRMEDLGCRAVFLTVDTPVVGRRERDLRSRYQDTAGVITSLGTFSDPSLTWDFVDWLRDLTPLPLVLKGIQRGEDAVLAERHGAAGILVSNHGGRQLDGARASLDALVEVRQFLGPDSRLEVFLDGGIRRGSDVVKALALGARAVGLARPVLYGLAAYGVPGAEAVLRLLQEEILRCMALCGAPDIQSISRDLVIRA